MWGDLSWEVGAKKGPVLAADSLGRGDPEGWVVRLGLLSRCRQEDWAWSLRFAL